ncbi:MAG: FtsX-like permease family protein [Candidatus Heimdallarchaeota archaeon]|nr:FtsX-like permease family protein [Candidatus Heimdallarchaeota archaeon]
MKSGFYLSLAFKNIFNHKRHMLIIAFGIVMSLSVSLSINHWSLTAEDLAINDYLDLQDYQSYIISREFTEDIPAIKDFISPKPIVDNVSTVYATYGLFNTEHKPADYFCFPEDEQADPSDPVSITNAFIATQDTLDRIAFLFDVQGNFSVVDNGLVLSWDQVRELSTIFGRDIVVGDTLNVSIAKKLPNPSYGENTLFDFKPTHFVNYTVRGIYTFKESISITQAAFNLDRLTDSVIFPYDSLSLTDREAMIDNQVISMLFVKFNKEFLIDNGFDQVVEKMNAFSESVKAEFPYSFVFILDSPIESLISTYSRASIAIVFMVPVILTGLMLTIFVINIVTESRGSEIALLRDRGATTFQILLLFLLELLIVSLVGILLGLVFSVVIAAIIPSFSLSSFISADLFTKFFLNMKISPSFTLLLSSSCLVIVMGYSTFKIWRELVKKEGMNSVGGNESRKDIEKNLLVGLNVGLVLITLAALIFTVIDTLNKTGDSRTFNLASTTSAGYAFILFCLLLFFSSEGASLLFNRKILGSLKQVYKRITFNDSFFLVNNLKREQKRLTTMLFPLVLIGSILIFSLVSSSSIAYNQQLEANFKNGADLRVTTRPLPYHFKDNISHIDGVNEVVPILKARGRVAYDYYTVYGVNPNVYARVGYWHRSSFASNGSFNILKQLAETSNGAIISQSLAERLNLSLGDILPISDLPGGVYYRRFTVVGLIHSAPGLGLAEGKNLELQQPYNGFILLNSNYLRGELSVNYCQLFLASILPGESKSTIEGRIAQLSPEIQVNPSTLNEGFVGSFITAYIPNVLSFFWIGFIATALIGFILLIMFTDFILTRRSQEFAIILSMGGSRTTLSKLISFELLVIIIASSLSSILLGIGFTYASFTIITPILTTHNIIPFSITIPFWQLVFFPLAMIFATMLGTLPSIIIHNRKEVITSLKQ